MEALISLAVNYADKAQRPIRDRCYQINGVKSAVSQQTDLSKNIHTRTGSVNQLAMEIERAVTEQKTSVEEMNKSIMFMSEETSTIAHNAETLKERIYLLTGVSETLQTIISRFKL